MCNRWPLPALLALALLSPGCGTSEDHTLATSHLPQGDADRGKQLLRDHGCIACHTIASVHGADGLVGPPLDRMGSRSYIGGVLNNTPDNLVRWIQDPPSVDPQTAMPNLGVTHQDAQDIARFLYTLR